MFYKNTWYHGLWFRIAPHRHRLLDISLGCSRLLSLATTWICSHLLQRLAILLYTAMTCANLVFQHGVGISTSCCLLHDSHLRVASLVHSIRPFVYLYFLSFVNCPFLRASDYHGRMKAMGLFCCFSSSIGDTGISIGVQCVAYASPTRIPSQLETSANGDWRFAFT